MRLPGANLGPAGRCARQIAFTPPPHREPEEEEKRAIQHARANCSSPRKDPEPKLGILIVI